MSDARILFGFHAVLSRLRQHSASVQEHLRVIATAEDVATTRECSQLLGGEFQVVGYMRKSFDLNHVCRNPETMVNIARSYRK